MTNKKYQVKATRLLKEIKTYLGSVKDSDIVELIRKDLIVASLEGKLESLKENK